MGLETTYKDQDIYYDERDDSWYIRGRNESFATLRLARKAVDKQSQKSYKHQGVFFFDETGTKIIHATATRPHWVSYHENEFWISHDSYNETKHNLYVADKSNVEIANQIIVLNKQINELEQNGRELQNQLTKLTQLEEIE